MSKPVDPMDPYDFRRAVTDIEADQEYGKHVFVRYGDGERFFRITSVELDSDGDMIITADPNS